MWAKISKKTTTNIAFMEETLKICPWKKNRNCYSSYIPRRPQKFVEISQPSWFEFCTVNVKSTDGELIYTCKIGFLAGSNLQVRIKPDIFSRFSQPEHFSRFKLDHLLLNRARFSGDNLCYKLTFLAGLNLQVQTWITMQVSPDNPILQA